MYKSFYYIYIVAKNTVEQKKKLIFQMVNHALFLFLSFFLYRYVYELLPNLQNKLPLPNAIWSMAMYFIVYWLSLHRIERNFREDIRSGNIEMYLLRPISYIWQKVLIQVGEGLISFLSASVLSIGISYFFVGLPEVNTPFLVWFLGVAVLFILSQVLLCLLYVLCGLSGFWLENSR